MPSNPKLESDKDGGYPHTLSFRLSDDQFDIWTKKVSRSGMTKSEFFREAVINNQTEVVGDASRHRAVRVKKPANPELRKSLFLLAQSSQNINQVAHRLNSDHKVGIVSAELYEAVLQKLQEISASLKEGF